MAKHVEVQQILKDVERFLPQVKDSKLNTQGRKLKKEIQRKIDHIKEDKSELSTRQTGPSPTAAQDSFDDLYEETEFTKNEQDQELLKKNVPASDRADITREGKLKYRKEKSGNKAKFQKRKQWCALRANIFYIYEKSSSKKQTECFFVDGYQVTPMDVEQTKKEQSFPFEMIQDGKKTYVFFASTAEDQKLWVDLLNQVTGIGRRQRPVTIIEGDQYESVDHGIQEATGDASDPDSHPAPEDDQEAIYDDTLMTNDDPDTADDRASSMSDPAGRSLLYRSQSFSDGQPIQDPVVPPKVTSAAERNEPPYSDMYYGIWDNEIQHPQELAFKRGDVITVLSKQFEDKGWWVGELSNNIGLVPVSYLTPAYQRL